MTILLMCTLLWQEPIDISSSQSIYATGVKALSFAQNDHLRLLGTDASCTYAVDGGQWMPTELEEHQVTALLIDDQAVWAGAMSIYNPGTALLFGTRTDSLPEFHFIRDFPPNVGAISRIFVQGEALIFLLPRTLFYSVDAGTTIMQMLSTSDVMDVVCVDDLCYALANDGDSSGLFVSGDITQWEPVVLSAPIGDAVSISPYLDHVLVANKSGEIFAIDGETVRLWGQSQTTGLTSVAYNDSVLLVAHEAGQLSYFNEREHWIYPRQNRFLAASRLFVQEDQFFYNCVSAQPLAQVHCLGMYAWYPFGLLDLNDDRAIDEHDVQALLMQWHQSEPDFSGDEVVNGNDLALILSYLSQSMTP